MLNYNTESKDLKMQVCTWSYSSNVKVLSGLTLWHFRFQSSILHARAYKHLNLIVLQLKEKRVSLLWLWYSSRAISKRRILKGVFCYRLVITNCMSIVSINRVRVRTVILSNLYCTIIEIRKKIHQQNKCWRCFTDVS